MAVALPLFLLVAAAAAASCCCCSAGRDFYVGGRDGWTANPAEPFNRWAERNRFQINDRIVFSYSAPDDSVLVVSESHYDACNTTDPFLRLEGGDSVFVLSNSGPYFFISGDAGRCQAGERLIVVVLAMRDRGNTPAPPSPSKSSPPVPAPPASRRLPPPPLAAGNSTSPGPALPPPSATNATASPPSPSSAPTSRGGFLMCLVIAAGAIFLA